MRLLCGRCRLKTLSGSKKLFKRPVPGDVCDRCTDVFVQPRWGRAHWRPSTAVEALRMSVGVRPKDPYTYTIVIDEVTSMEEESVVEPLREVCAQGRPKPA